MRDTMSKLEKIELFLEDIYEEHQEEIDIILDQVIRQICRLKESILRAKIIEIIKETENV